MNRLKNIFLGMLAFAAAASLSGCAKDVLFDESAGAYDGPVSVKLGISFNPLAEGLTTRGVDSNLDFDIRDLTILFYAADADEQTGKPAICRRYTLNDDYYTDIVERDSRTEAGTRQAYITIDDIERGSGYRIYAAANVADILTEDEMSELSEEDLREQKIMWDAERTGTADKDPRKHNIPDAMFGYFSAGDQADVIHHDPLLYRSSDNVTANRAEVITFSRPKVELHAWLKRVVSRLTVGFDGSQLNEGVEIYIKSVRVKDAVTSCFLGHDNSAAYDSDLVVSANGGDDVAAADDARLTFVYSTEEGAAGDAVTKATPAFPRENSSDKTKGESGWNTEWYDYVHGNTTENLNPAFDGKPTTLYFMENLQGVSPDADAKGHHDASGSDSEADLKDGMPYGTYVEVEAYYVNEETSGNIVYRFMLGQNVTDDFNVIRNHHYRLILSFKGDANNPDWHIEYTEDEDKPYAWFPIPTESQWNDSWVWHAYNDAGEPVAEICREMVYWHPDSDLDWTKESSVAVAGRRSGLIYYQVVTVYPVKKDKNPVNAAYTYTVDLSRGMVAQVLSCASKSVMDDTDLKAGGTINMLKRTQGAADLFAENKKVSGIDGYYAIRRLTNGGEDNYSNVIVWSEDFDTPAPGKITLLSEGAGARNFTEDPDADTGNTIYNMEFGDPVTREFRIAPYKISDADGNGYSVVKIGGAYWTRDYVKATSYFLVNSDGNSLSAEGGQKIYPYSAPKEEQTYNYLRGGGWSERKLSRQIEGGGQYDYDFGPSEEEEGYVAYFERYPMYKDCNGVRMYNFFAASGTASGVFGSDGKEIYKKETTPRYSAQCPLIDPIYLQNGDGLYDIDQGKLNMSLYNTAGTSHDTGNSGAYRNDFTIADMSSKYYQNILAPENWHALPTAPSYVGYTCGYFGELKSDFNYLETFSNYNWGHFCATSRDSWSFPTYSGAPLNWNTSGLSISPIPTDWETNDSNIDIAFSTSSSVSSRYDREDAMNGRVIVCWESTLNTDLGYGSNVYPQAGFLAYEDWFAPVEWAFELTWWSLLDESYQPIRFVRNAYDYSVAPIAAKE